MITEEHLTHILKGMNYHLASLANEVDVNKFHTKGVQIGNEYLSLEIMQAKIALLKFHLEWIEVDMQEDGV